MLVSMIHPPIKNLLILAGLSGWLCFSCRTDNRTAKSEQPTSDTSLRNASVVATYTNPVLAGDFPDPSVIRIGKDYWATATTSEWAPVFPLLRSDNLIDWKVV